MTDTERERINAICEVAGVTEIDDLSDGFHTFRQLYYQRMMLFAVIVRQNKDKAWKSLRHEDGELCFGGGWFIVGVDTQEGSYTYHYEDNYFSLFDCEELERGKHWDGHTEKDVTRLLSLPSVQPDHTADINKKISISYGHENDLISRQAAIELKPEFLNPNVNRETEEQTAIDRAYARGWNSCNTHWIDEISELPFAQSESTRTFVELVVEYPDPDLCAYKEYKGKPYYSIKYIENGETYVGYGTYKPEVLSQFLKEYFISSVQSEPLTDKEQRIFLAAMGREEKVCEEVDRNSVREPYEDSLVRICKEIRRKVKGVLWT